jgi:hypothetical protein
LNSDFERSIHFFAFSKSEFLSVRILLELNEVFLRKNGFNDVWKEQKQHENSQALKLLSKRLSEIGETQKTLIFKSLSSLSIQTKSVIEQVDGRRSFEASSLATFSTQEQRRCRIC